ncbi:MAG: 2,3-bisphosphoglycerate-independent phosphoglycerate mutase [Christensenellaceae bacterium]|jgi:2,3-bisphosphoglycerate-independent phosphoglycerate mutase|nr:2,3-bisphosphoglycerate-independent phosphoglycerate mutase [Christensenellaceae bacterium]
MKYILVIGDGMADLPQDALGGRTPLEAAQKPLIDSLAARGIVGKARTVPIGVPPGSDTAILSIFGFDPREVYTGRSPLEAAGSGLELKAGNISFRCNLCAISELGEGGAYEEQTMLSHSGGAIEGELAQALMRDLIADEGFAALLAEYGLWFQVNPSYRHIAVLEKGSDRVTLEPPHEILGQGIKKYLPKGDGEGMLLALMKASYEILGRHPINEARRREGKPAANSLWFWGQGKAVRLSDFGENFGHFGGVITAVPLVKGIARLAGLPAPEVEGANGELDTNYEGKVEAALLSLQKNDFAALHIEAPDEMSHAGDLEKKLEAIARIDRRVFAPLLVGLDKLKEPYRILFLSDHYTLLSSGGHEGSPVPFLLYDSRVDLGRGLPYGEPSAELGGLMEDATKLMPLLFEQ